MWWTANRDLRLRLDCDSGSDLTATFGAIIIPGVSVGGTRAARRPVHSCSPFLTLFSTYSIPYYSRRPSSPPVRLRKDKEAFSFIPGLHLCPPACLPAVSSLRLRNLNLTCFLSRPATPPKRLLVRSQPLTHWSCLPASVLPHPPTPALLSRLGSYLASIHRTYIHHRPPGRPHSRHFLTPAIATSDARLPQGPVPTLLCASSKSPPLHPSPR